MRGIASKQHQDLVAQGVRLLWRLVIERGYADTAAGIFANDPHPLHLVGENKRCHSVSGLVVGEIVVGVLLLGDADKWRFGVEG
ncbi:MAG: hypothetical protein JO023_10700 [Chloroflexi bacterium]|nr:hypothetical protein [Chloroflexota bacterium]